MMLRSLLALFLVFSVALAAAFTGCGGSACFRNSDCNSGFGCRTGVCQLLNPPDAGDAGDASDDAGDAGSNLGAAGATQ